ncbi:hypothetical protein Peur_058922 [Populus x canadensis]
MSFRDTIKYHKAYSQNKANTMIFLRHHPNEVLEIEYLTENAQPYSKLISCLFVVGKHNKLLMKNYISQLISSALFLEVNAIIYNNNYGHVRGHGRGRGRRHGRRWNNFHNNNSYSYQDNNDIYFDHLDMKHLDVANFFKKMIIKLIFLIMIIIS